jgi:hypothetical protein
MIRVQAKEGNGKEGVVQGTAMGRKPGIRRRKFRFRAIKSREANRGLRARAAAAKRRAEDPEAWLSTVREMKRKNGFVPM